MDADAAGLSRIGTDDDAVAKLGEHLAAGTARTERGTGRDDGNRLEVTVALADGLLHGDTLRAIGQSVACVLDVDARVHLPAFREQRRADAKLRIGSKSVPLGHLRGSNQFAEFEGTRLHNAPMNSVSNLASLSCAARPTSRTSSCESFLLEMPAARLVMQETPATSML